MSDRQLSNWINHPYGFRTFYQWFPTFHWFRMMALRHCGRDYGSTRLNAYFFYRKVYRMTPKEAFYRASIL